MGGAGLGSLTIQSQGTLYIGTNLSIGGLGTVNLNGGAIRFDGYSRAPGGVVDFASGTVQVAGDRTIDTDAAIKDLFGPRRQSDPEKTCHRGERHYFGRCTIDAHRGKTLAANSLVIVVGQSHDYAQSSQVLGPVLAQTGSVTDVMGGDLALGDATKVTGYYCNGTLNVGLSTVTLADADGAVFDAAAQVTLGAVASPGTLAAAGGLTLNSGGNIAGHGTIDTPDDIATPLVNDGAFNGNSMAVPLTLPGFVIGNGSMDNEPNLRKHIRLVSGRRV